MVYLVIELDGGDVKQSAVMPDDAIESVADGDAVMLQISNDGEVSKLNADTAGWEPVESD